MLTPHVTLTTIIIVRKMQGILYAGVGEVVHICLAYQPVLPSISSISLMTILWGVSFKDPSVALAWCFDLRKHIQINVLRLGFMTLIQWNDFIKLESFPPTWDPFCHWGETVPMTEQIPLTESFSLIFITFNIIECIVFHGCVLSFPSCTARFTSFHGWCS